jgi:hypothetical protein
MTGSIEGISTNSSIAGSVVAAVRRPIIAAAALAAICLVALSAREAAGEDNYRGPWTATTPNPILLINQRYGPNTGYANAVHTEQLLGNVVLLTQEGYGHLSFQNPSTASTRRRSTT